MKRTLILSVSITTLVAALFLFSCSKINVATDLGQNVLPPIDNVHTFDTTIDVTTTNGQFALDADSFRTGLAFYQMIGKISSDPLFGKTDAQMYLQLSPTAYPFKNVPGKLYLDSVVLVLKHAGTYGDTTIPQTLQVSEIDQSAQFRVDSSYLLSQTFPTAGVLGTATVIPAHLKDSFQVVSYPNTHTTANEIRIKLDNSFGQRLLAYDSAGASAPYHNDSTFRTFFKGFAIKSTGGGNGLMVVRPSGDASDSSLTSLVVYYKYDDPTTAGKIDTSFASITLGANDAVASNIQRDYSGSPAAAAFASATPASLLYIQATPGSYANLKIPGLKGFPNCVVHLAELQMESVYDVSDSLFGAPQNMLVDVFDSTAMAFKLMPYAFPITSQLQSDGKTYYFSISSSSGFYSTNTTGQTYYYKKDPSGNLVKQWRFNLTPYVQKYVNGIIPLYSMRLYAPAYTRLPAGDVNALSGTQPLIFPAGTTTYTPAVGRVRLGGGNHPTQRMKLRLVYSKL
ncbi:DUF4270 domain-containing protein [Niabella soli]|uniref:DUF4270 domain-containing protein n=1 Tax=Niabella soli DSM 19437 TaxID=929713 RepID=W0F6G2_9BACT|nr:DUF4270 domain-containing protein [Niabella soli]AHF17398.1 hypothetical protein NIASO_06775 [Niabella soli DSM 19437]